MSNKTTKKPTNKTVKKPIKRQEWHEPESVSWNFITYRRLISYGR